jgi:hypothetical protein
MLFEWKDLILLPRKMASLSLDVIHFTSSFLSLFFSHPTYNQHQCTIIILIISYTRELHVICVHVPKIRRRLPSVCNAF